MFGMTPKRGGLFGNPAERYAPGPYDMSAGGAPAGDPALAASAVANPKRKGLFGTGIQLSDVIGIAGDAVAINRGMTPMFAQQQQQERLLKQRQMLDAAARGQEWNDWVRKQEYEAAHPKPEAPDAFERALRGAGIDPTSDQGRELYAGRAQAMARDPNDEFVVVPIPGVGTYAGPRSGLSEAMGGGTAPKPVGKLTPINGGPTPQASGTFLDAFAPYSR